MEKWQTVIGELEVSNQGRVRIGGIIKKPYDSGNGYKEIQYNNTKYKIHRLVAETFIPNPNNKEDVHHRDGNKWNNKRDNLIWLTRSEHMTIHKNRQQIKNYLRDKKDNEDITFWRSEEKANNDDITQDLVRKQNEIVEQLNNNEEVYTIW